MIPWLDEGTKQWNAATGGTAVQDNVTFEEKQIKQAGIIATQDSSWDMMYMTEAYGYMFKFGARLCEEVTTDWFPDGVEVYSPTAVKALTSPDGVWRALPLYEMPSVWNWNKKIFEEIGEDPENPPDNYPALIALTPKIEAAGYIACIQPWIATQANLFALLYWTKIYNSTGHPMFSEDRTQLMFDGPEGLKTFEIVEQGIKSNFWHKDYMNIVNEHDAFALFGEGKTATVMNSESPVLPEATAAVTGVRQHPGIDPGTTGSTGGADGLGVSKFSVQQDAAKSWARYNFGFDVTKAAATTVVDADGNPLHYAVARLDVLELPEVQEALPLLEAYALQRQGSTALWPTPYDINPVFNEVISKMISGEMTAAQAHEQAVTQTQDAIIKYLSA
jgi:ABC-type glycerol-3-phosphate transport system substrate-binding protein